MSASVPEPAAHRFLGPTRRHGLLAAFASLLVLGCYSAPQASSSATAVSATSGNPMPQPRLEDWIAEPGTQQAFKPFMLHADYWVGINQRAKLDTIVFALDNGARCCQVTNRDSTWAVDYTWVYPHNLLPPRWYDANALFHVGDSLHLADNADLRLTFGTMRLGVRAKSLQQATAEAYRQWPAEMPVPLRGRLNLKLDRARKALETDPTFKPASKGR